MRLLQAYLKQLEPQLQTLKERYAKLEQREQRLLQGLVVVLPCFMFIFFYWQPMQHRLAQLEKSNIVLAKNVAEARLIAYQIMEKSQSKSQAQESLMAQVEQLAAKTKVRTSIVSLKPQLGLDGSKRIHIRFQKVAYAGAIHFLHALAEQGLALEQVKVSATEKKAFVDVNVWVIQP
ncbi:MAG: type II secretion system protein GspM [Mariprofundaceae bacterium]|nr:type II secretion system protein GspM [Mariprofundaceae bacterium]